MTTNKRVQYAVAALAAIAVAFGAYLAGDNGSSRAATAGAAAPPGTQVAPNEQPPAGGQFAPPSRVQVPPGFGAPVTGTTAERVARAALDEYAGTVERVMQLADGSYVVHVVTANGEVHVLVSKAFAVTGVEQGGLRGRGAPAPDGSQDALPSSGGTQT